MNRFSAIFVMTGFVFLCLVSASWADGSAANGKPNYEKLCASCHGTGGKGDGPASAQLPVKPRDHTDKNAMFHISDEELFNVIKGGGPAVGKSPLMPPFGTAFSDTQIHDLMAYVRSLAQ